MTTRTKLVTGAAALVSAGSLAFAGASLASADTTPSPSATTGTDTSGTSEDAQRDGRCPAGPRHEHAEVTGTERTKVEKAVTAKDSAVTVEHVGKGPDGAYHVRGSKAGEPVHVDVSSDLATVEVRTGGPGGRGPGRPGHAHTAASAAETAQVKAAIAKKDSGVSIEQVRKDPDGSYDALGTKAGQRVHVEVSKDFATVQVRTGGPGRGERPGPRPGGDASQTPAPSPTSPRTTPSTGTSPTAVPTPASLAA